MMRLNDGDEVAYETHGGELLMVMRGVEDTRVVFAQVPLLRSQLDALKRRSGTTTTKDALTVAVNHYLHCSALNDDTDSDVNMAPERGRMTRTELEERAEEEDWWWAPPVKGER